MIDLGFETKPDVLEKFVNSDEFPGWGNQEMAEVYGEDPLFIYFATKSAWRYCDKHRSPGRSLASVYKDLGQMQQADGHWDLSGKDSVISTALGVMTLSLPNRRFWFCTKCREVNPVPGEGEIGFEI